MYVCSISIFAIFCAFSHIELTAEACSQVNEIDISRKIEFAMRTNNYVELGEVLRQNVPNNMTLKKVQKIAKKMKSRSLHRAVRSTKSLFQSQNVRFSLTSGEFLQAALFIESQLPNFLKNNQYYLKNNQYYLKKEETSLACDLEYDLNRERAFLALPNNAENYLGKGGHKIVTKAILYDKNMPEVVAKAQLMNVRKKEMRMLKLFQGTSGIVDIIGFTKFKDQNNTFRSLYSKLYTPGSLTRAFVDQHVFSLPEKLQIAHSLLVGLTELHKKNIAHRDIACDNCLIDVSQEKKNSRIIVAVLADFGSARYIWERLNVKSRIQGHLRYTPPEGIFKDKMSGEDYFFSDVYALGCVFYRLFHGKVAPWQHSKYVLNTEISQNERYNELVDRINEYTQARRIFLGNKKKESRLSTQDLFEDLILRMVNPDPRNRGTAALLSKELHQILQCVDIN